MTRDAEIFIKIIIILLILVLLFIFFKVTKVWSAEVFKHHPDILSLKQHQASIDARGFYKEIICLDFRNPTEACFQLVDSNTVVYQTGWQKPVKKIRQLIGGWQLKQNTKYILILKYRVPGKDTQKLILRGIILWRKKYRVEKNQSLQKLRAFLFGKNYK